jgi:prolyl 4-hydroxylase
MPVDSRTQTITDELRRWIVAQAEAGARPQDVLQAMRASGWSEDVAIEALEQTLTQRLKELGKPLPDSVAEPSPTTPLPEPALAGQPHRIVADGHEVAVRLTLAVPRVIVFDHLLSDAECDELIALSRSRLARSETVDNATGGSEVNPARTSRGMFFLRGETPLIDRIERRISALLRWPVDHGEGLQILNYEPGAEYKPHHDYFDPAQPGMAAVLKRGGQRVGTLVIYLNTPQQGGGTVFPDVQLEVAPIKGNAVFFSYERAHASTRTLHGGAPVIAGDKWVATKWLREGEFV